MILDCTSGECASYVAEKVTETFGTEAGATVAGGCVIIDVEETTEIGIAVKWFAMGVRLAHTELFIGKGWHAKL